MKVDVRFFYHVVGLFVIITESKSIRFVADAVNVYKGGVVGSWIGSTFSLYM